MAALDAVLWPALFVVLLANAPARLGIVGPLGITVVVVVGAHRLARAVWRNERYRFTTWRWGRAVALVLVVGFALKLLIA